MPRSRLAREAGIDVILATARSPRSVQGIASDAGLGGIAVCANGAIVYDLDAQQIVAHTPLEATVAHRLVQGLRERVPGIVFGWELELRFGSEPAYEALRDPDLVAATRGLVRSLRSAGVGRADDEVARARTRCRSRRAPCAVRASSSQATTRP